MAREPAARERNPWLPYFIVSIAVFTGSIVALAIVLFDVISDGETRGPGESVFPPTTSPESTSTPASLTYAGALPASANGLALAPSEPGKAADIEFVTGAGEDSVPVRYFVPVAALGAGVDALTSQQLQDIWAGTVTDWGELGGVPGEIDLASGPDSQIGDLSLLKENADHFDSYEALRAAMTLDSGIITFVPIEELRPAMVAIAVDGADIARGIGDPASWPFAERIEIVSHTKKGEGALAQVKEAVAAKLPTITRIVATGDVLQSRCSLAAIEATGDWGAALRSPVGQYLASADLALSSLDGSIQGLGEPYGCIAMEYPNLTSPPEVIEALTLAGIDEMTLATNHAFDCGMGACGGQALIESMTRLNAAGIKTVGGGHNLEEALAPAIFEVHGLKVGVLGFDDIAAEDLEATEDEVGTAPLDDSYEDERNTPPREPAFYKPAEMLGVTRLQERIKALKQQVDVVIVQIQSGTEDTHTPSPRSIKGLRAAADAGADLVVGNQAHWVQAVEVRNDVFIGYALGNFIFDQTWTPEHTQGYLLEATFHEKHLATVRMVPYQIENKYKPMFVEGETRAKVLGDIVDASVALANN
ncbi:MAG: CapA family protein [Dehalococcoidia bacterium]